MYTIIAYGYFVLQDLQYRVLYIKLAALIKETALSTLPLAQARALIVVAGIAAAGLGHA